MPFHVRPLTVPLSQIVFFTSLCDQDMRTAVPPNQEISTTESSCQAKKRTSFRQLWNKFIVNFAEYWNYILSAEHRTRTAQDKELDYQKLVLANVYMDLNLKPPKFN